ncbi:MULTISPECIES: sigma-54-dependent transcriptional regulator [Leeuwenhoekiella]|uniref:sigma-54-dependent transcriptional regulator n=1 Tax=Leeuwenhoekiella TaxID=283735 RepID=UPI000C486F34|nr:MULTISPECIES: sigma-54 dependent transcriptional regulator [Leeuwenhoekiella]MAO43908.1 sigma-54-dependent Fis family transcriptional regulator [Leeuwenhoekiella sp.]HBT10765.1 sigma-54-dependent Fis family transcriptional regulator [Leeuwenhoekiella sp.]
MSKILLIEDDVAFCKMLETFLSKKGYELISAFAAGEAYKILANHAVDLVITDVRLPDDDGLSILKHIKEDYNNIPVILMTGYAEVNKAVEAMKEGAFDYISKPVRPDELLKIVDKALQAEAEEEPKTSKKAPKSATAAPQAPTGFIKGVSDASAKLNQYIDLVAPTNMSILITGDSGTGKEYVAKSIHDKSKRQAQPFIAVDCGAIPKEIAGSEFFGHVKGSFTGAVNDKVGHFEAANGGTLFLDEIGNLSYELQVQLLRALQERKIKPVGSNNEIAVDIRVVAATNEDLEEAVKEGDFREDLYHRLNEFSIEVPRLRERQEDLMLFINLFLDQANKELEKEVEGFSPDAVEALIQYSWPGNLRELKNIVKRMVLLAPAAVIPKELLPREIRVAMIEDKKDDYALFNAKNEQERILDALEKTGGNKSKAARLLDIDRKTLYNKLKQYDIKL